MNTTPFVILLSGLAVMDMVYTFWNVRILKKSGKRWCQTEYNPLVRMAWKRFGLYMGTAVAAFITLAGVVLAGLVIGENEFFQGMMIGVYVMVHHVHYVNYAHISKKYLGKELPILGRIFTEW